MGLLTGQLVELEAFRAPMSRREWYYLAIFAPFVIQLMAVQQLLVEHLHGLRRRTLIRKRRPLALAADTPLVASGRRCVSHGLLLLMQFALVSVAHLLVQ